MVEELEVIEEVTDGVKPEMMLSADSDGDIDAKGTAPDSDEGVLSLEITADNDKKAEEIIDEEAPKAPVADDDTPAEPKKAEEIIDEEAPKAPVADDDVVAEEIIDEEALTDEDMEREAVLNEINEIADSADRSLNVKVPFIDKRLTKGAVANKFLSLNKHLLDKKYHSLVDSGIKLDNKIYDTMLGSVKNKARLLTKIKGSKASATKSYGFIDSGKGYSVDSNF